MKRLAGSAVAIALFLWLSEQVLAGGAPMMLRAGQPKLRPQAPAIPAAPSLRTNWRHNIHPAPAHAYKQQHHYYHHPYRYYHYHHPYRYYHPPVIIVGPNYYYPYYYPYYAPATVLLSSPFYCFIHHEGFVSRIGFLDHVSGTHKLALETAASVCPEGGESCVIEGY